jgi:hypothetical protein
MATDEETSFYSDKIHSAQFFISRVLPVIQGKVIALSNEEFSLADVYETCSR